MWQSVRVILTILPKLAIYLRACLTFVNGKTLQCHSLISLTLQQLQLVRTCFQFICSILFLSIFDRSLPKINKEGARKTIICRNITRFCYSIFSLFTLYTVMPDSKIVNGHSFRYFVTTLKKIIQHSSLNCDYQRIKIQNFLHKDNTKNFPDKFFNQIPSLIYFIFANNTFTIMQFLTT